jgi:Zn-dependent protease
MNETLHVLFAVVMWSLSFFVFGFLHEFGHIAMYRKFGGDKNWVLTMGWGRTIIKTKRITINSLFMLPGRVNWSREKASASHAILWFSGGFIVNIICAGFLFFLILHLRQFFPVENFDIWSLDRILRVAFLTNIYIIIGTVIPMTYSFGGLKGMSSDGLQIYNVCREIHQAKSIK